MPDHARDTELAERCASWMRRENIEVWTKLSALREHVRYWASREGVVLSANRVNGVMVALLRPRFEGDDAKV